MTEITERLDLLKKRIQEEDFLQGKGLSNEVNIQMFCYKPEQEMAVRYFYEHLKDENLKCNIQIVDLYETFLEICEDEDILDSLNEIEQEEGKEFLEEQFNNLIDAKKFAEKVMRNYDESSDLLLITGVGKAFPFIRVHNLLNTLQSDYDSKKPIVVLYPGSFDGHAVKLFNTLKANEYYRAFNMI